MSRWLKVTLLTVGLVVWSGLAAYCGGVVGFMEGFLAGRMLTAPSDAVSLSVALRALREDRQASGLELLETQLDGYISSYNYFLRSGDSVFDIFNFTQHAPAFMSYVARYRGEHPPSDSETDASQRIHEILSQYERDEVAGTEQRHADQPSRAAVP